MQIQSDTGRALDISGAFLFAGLFLGCLWYGFNLFALGCGFASIAFTWSWRTWDAPDYSEAQFGRTICALFALFSIVSFVVAIIIMVLA